MRPVTLCQQYLDPKKIHQNSKIRLYIILTRPVLFCKRKLDSNTNDWTYATHIWKENIKNNEGAGALDGIAKFIICTKI